MPRAFCFPALTRKDDCTATRAVLEQRPNFNEEGHDAGGDGGAGAHEGGGGNGRG